MRKGSWDGDIDSLAQPPDPQDWRQVQANAHACNGGQCEHFRSCAFFKARRQTDSSLRTVALRHGKALPASTRPDAVAFAQLVTSYTDRLAIVEHYWIEA